MLVGLCARRVSLSRRGEEGMVKWEGKRVELMAAVKIHDGNEI